ncbi:unnamed protein product [Symbiodinium sp. CCMP2592]|nr:unnamed protein product [Symbiodinium sp. CCMP2592]
MPAPDKSGAASVRPLDTEEMGRWLRHLLTGSGSKQADRKLSSHSCKCTMLSYAAKRGISIVDRQLLGYHTTPRRMALTYSRDSAAHPLMILERMIKEIRDRVFLPDETRSGRLVGKAADSQQRPEVVVIKEEHDPPSPSEGADADHNLAGDEEALDAEATGHITTDSSSSVPNMSTVIESEAAFKQRCAEASKDATLHTKLGAQGITCFKTLAFAIGSPQQPPTEAQFDEFSVKVYGVVPTMGQTAILRHLHFEATTLVVQTYRDMVTHDPSDPSHTRLEFQKRRLSAGMEISGELEPSHQLLDIANQQYESGVLTWIPASKCAKREAEVLALGKDKSSLLQVEQNIIKMGPGDQAIACDVSDPLRFQWAMMRRGIAFDNCHLLSWEVHQRWVQKMLDCLSATPPPSYSPVSLNQCMRADKELFLLLAREAAPPFKVDSLGVSPLDAKFSAMMYDVRLQQFLLPLPKQTAPVLAVPVDDGAGDSSQPVPKGTEDGNVCWDFNLASGCSLKTEKGKGVLHDSSHSEDCTSGAAATGEQTRPLVYRALEQVRGLRRDENNRDGPTLLVPLTDFENGELWFQKAGGDVSSLNDPSLEGRGTVAELSCLHIRCVSARSSGLNYELPSQHDASSVQQSAAGMYFVELCAGRAGEQVVIMDLSDPAQAEAVVDFLRVEYHHVLCVFISPPVGVASGWLADFACDLGILTVLESHRPKLMQLWSSQDVFGMLEGRCDGSHEHKPWRPFISKRKRVSFITADEPEFPPLLVDRIIGCIFHAHPSLSFGPRVLAQAIQDPSANVARINLGTQPRGNSLPSLVWEFDTTLDFLVPVQNEKPLEAVLSSLPKGSRIFSRRVCEWGSLKSLLEGVGKLKTNIVGLDPLHPPAFAELVQVGVPCSEDVFVERAMAAGHPRSLAVHVEPFVTVSARANFEAPPSELAAFRIDAMKFWIGRAGALKEKEQELHRNLPDHLRPILKGKKLLLLQEMMRAAGCEDVDLVQKAQIQRRDVGSFVEGISIALWKIGIVLFRLFWSAFFDDYSIVSAKSLESNAQWTVETLFDLLGFRFARDGSKAEPFGVTFNMLGLSVDLSCVKQRILRVGHTQKRKEELSEYIQTILQEGKIDSKAAERLRGRMVFFEGFTFGRVSNRAQRVVAKCVEKSAPQNLTEDLMWALTWLRERIAMSQPLVVERNLITTLIVFTDGACNPEEGTGGVGGVLVNASGTPCEFFGEAVPSDLMQQLLSISVNPIFELELIPALISLIIWADCLKGAQVVFYLDNDGARHSLIRTFGGSPLANSVIESFLQLETTLQLKTWFARVPTACNIADNPSRLEFEPLLKRGAARRAIPWDQVMP